MTANGPPPIDVGGRGGGMLWPAPMGSVPVVRTGKIGSVGGGKAVTTIGGRVGKPIRGIPSNAKEKIQYKREI